MNHGFNSCQTRTSVFHYNPADTVFHLCIAHCTNCKLRSGLIHNSCLLRHFFCIGHMKLNRCVNLDSIQNFHHLQASQEYLLKFSCGLHSTGRTIAASDPAIIQTLIADFRKWKATEITGINCLQIELPGIDKLLFSRTGQWIFSAAAAL